MIAITSAQPENHSTTGERSIMNELKSLLTGKQSRIESSPNQGSKSIDAVLDSFNSQIWLNQNFKFRMLKAIEKTRFNNPDESLLLNEMVNEHTEFIIKLATESMRQVIDSYHSAAHSFCKEFGTHNFEGFGADAENKKIISDTDWIREWENQTSENAWFK